MKVPHTLVYLVFALGVISCSETTNNGAPVRWSEPESFPHAMAQDFHCAVVTSQSPENVGRTFPLTPPQTETPTLATFQEAIDRSRDLDRYAALGPVTTIGNEVCQKSRYFFCRLVPNHPKIWTECAGRFLERAKNYPQDYAEFDPDHMYLNRLIEMGALIKQSLAAFGSSITYRQFLERQGPSHIPDVIPADIASVHPDTKHSFLSDLMLRHEKLYTKIPRVLEKIIENETKDVCGGCNPWNLDKPLRPQFTEIPICGNGEFKAMDTQDHQGGAKWVDSKIDVIDTYAFGLSFYLPGLFTLAEHLELTNVRGCIEAVDFTEKLTPPIAPEHEQLHKNFPNANNIQGGEAFVRIRMTLRFAHTEKVDNGRITILHVTSPNWFFHEKPEAGQHYKIKEKELSRAVLLPTYMKDKLNRLMMLQIVRQEGIEEKTNGQTLQKERDAILPKVENAIGFIRTSTGYGLKSRAGLKQLTELNNLAAEFHGYRQAVLKGVDFAAGDAVASNEVKAFLRHFDHEIQTGDEFIQTFAHVVEKLVEKPKTSYLAHWSTGVSTGFKREWGELQEIPHFGRQSALDQTLQDLKNFRN